jgi:tetratricopeptide (TPR) repeat protein
MTERPNSFVPEGDAIRAAFAERSSGELVFFLRQCLERGGYDHVLAAAEAMNERFESDPALGLCLAVAEFVSGERKAALSRMARLAAAAPDDLNRQSVLAEMLLRAGEKRRAIEALVALVDRYPDYPGAQGTLASVLMPGPHYREVLRAIHDRLRPETYLEIGVESGATLALAKSARIAIGVDPADFPLENALAPGARVVRKESDRFFAETTREECFGARGVDLAFIDGMHLFEYALRDFVNVERFCHAGSTVILHDCLPIAKIAAERERKTRFWVGDTWKAAVTIARKRPDLRIRTILTPPSGLVVIRRLSPESTLLADELGAVIDELRDVAYERAAGDFPPELHPVSNDERGLAEALERPGAG